MGLPPGATLVSGTLPYVPKLPPGAKLVSGSVPGLKAPTATISAPAADSTDPNDAGNAAGGIHPLDALQKVQDLTQSGRSEHPVLAQMGDLARGTKELLFGGKSAGKPLGTDTGIVNNPVTQVVAGAPGGAASGAALEDAAVNVAKSPTVRAAAKMATDAVLDEVPGYKTAKKVVKLADIGKIDLPADAFDTSEAEKAITPFEGVGKPKPPPSIRRGPGEILPERVGAPAAAAPVKATPTTGKIALPEGAVLVRPPAGLLTAGTEEAPAAAAAAPKKTVNEIVDAATNAAQPLDKTKALRQQLTRGTPGSDVATRTAPRTVAPEKLPATITDQVEKQMGGSEEGESAKARLERLYPNAGMRQMVHANGEDIVDAAGEDEHTLKAIHDLTRVDLRQALINSGEDMGQTTVSNSKFAGEGSIGREQAFKKLLAKGHTPAEIVKMAKTAPLSQMAHP
jgi:hypothetical protein